MAAFGSLDAISVTTSVGLLMSYKIVLSRSKVTKKSPILTATAVEARPELSVTTRKPCLTKDR